MRFFSMAAERIRKSPFVIPIFTIFVVMFMASMGLSYEDANTGLLGYLAFPTRKVNLWVAPLVGILPQLVQIGFIYVFLEDTDKKRWAFWVAVIAHIIDVTTDVWYKVGGLGIKYIPLALLETWGIYTLGSEVMMTTSFGMILKLMPDFFREMGNVITSIKPYFFKFLGVLFGNIDEDKSNNRQVPYTDENRPRRGRPSKEEIRRRVHEDQSRNSFVKLPEEYGRRSLESYENTY